MSFMTKPPYQIYQDRNGDPLDNGYLYFGIASQNPQTAPIAIYWDSAGSVAASQPVRTTGGYTIRNGKPANIYVFDSYSLAVRESDETLVYSNLSVLPESNNEIKSLTFYGAVGDGTTDNAVAMQEAFTAGGGIYVPDGEFFTGTQLTLASDTYLFGPGTIKWSGNFDCLKATTKTNIVIDGVTFDGTGGYYALRVITASTYIRMVNCTVIDACLFASNDIDDNYAAQSSATYCTNLTIANNTGESSDPVLDTSFIAIAYSGEFAVTGNTANGHRFGVMCWGGNTVTQDPLVNERKCWNGTVTGNSMSPDNAGYILLVCRDIVVDGNALNMVDGDVMLDMESCLRCTISNNTATATGAVKGMYFYGLNVDCQYIGNTVTLGTATVMFANNIQATAGYEDMGAVTFKDNVFNSPNNLARWDQFVCKTVSIESNVFQNVLLSVGGETADSYVNQAFVLNNAFNYTFSPATDWLTQYGGGSAAFNDDYVPQFVIRGNTITNQTGSTITKDGFQFTECHENTRIVFTDNVTRGTNRGLLISTNAGTVVRALTVRSFDCDGTTPITNSDTTYATILGEGYWNTPAFDAGDFTSTGGGTAWDVAAGDVDTYSWTIVGTALTVRFSIRETDVTSTPTSLNIKIPNGYTSATGPRSSNACYVQDAGGAVVTGYVEVASAATVINVYNAGLAAFTATAGDNTTVQGQITIQVSQP